MKKNSGYQDSNLGPFDYYNFYSRTLYQLSYNRNRYYSWFALITIKKGNSTSWQPHLKPYKNPSQTQPLSLKPILTLLSPPNLSSSYHNHLFPLIYSTLNNEKGVWGLGHHSFQWLLLNRENTFVHSENQRGEEKTQELCDTVFWRHFVIWCYFRNL